MRRTRIEIWNFTLKTVSNISSEYKTDIDISAYRSLLFDDKFKLDLSIYDSVEKLVSEYIVINELLIRAFKNSYENLVIYMDKNIYPETEEEELVRLAEGSEYSQNTAQTEFRFSHTDVPFLM